MRKLQQFPNYQDGQVVRPTLTANFIEYGIGTQILKKLGYHKIPSDYSKSQSETTLLWLWCRNLPKWWRCKILKRIIAPKVENFMPFLYHQNCEIRLRNLSHSFVFSF